MSEPLESLIEQARHLSDEERELLLLRLQTMQDATADPAVEAEWQAEIERRLAAYDRGEVQAVPWEDVRRRLWAKYPGQ
jgi:putative addiction module component (TIGR02574 family)